MGIDLGLLRDRFPLVLALTAGLLLIKAVVLGALCLGFGLRRGAAAHVGLGLAQAGEFGFLIFALAAQMGVMPPETRQIAVLVVAASMVLTPVLLAAGRAANRFLEQRSGSPAEIDREAAEHRDHVLIAGYGRAGQTLGGLLSAAGVPFVAIDLNAAMVAQGRGRGEPVFFGNAGQADVLKAAGIARARAAMVTLDEAGAAERAVKALRRLDPDLPIVARARDPEQCDLLIRAGATRVVPELLEGSLQMGAALLGLVGEPQQAIDAALDSYRRETYGHVEGPARGGASRA